jgi:ADP-heptose:LPS heptosyltransferase
MAEKPKTIVLFLTCPGIGDFVKAVPTVRILSEQCDGRIITLVKEDSRFRNLLPVLPELGEIVFINTKKDTLFNRLKPGRVWANARAFAMIAAARADAALIFRSKKIYSYWAKFAGIPMRASLAKTGAETHWLKNGYDHIMEAYVSLARPLGVTATVQDLVDRQVIGLPHEADAFGKEYFNKYFDNAQKTVSLCIGGSINMWRWGYENFMALARALSDEGCNIFIATGTYENDAWEQYHEEIESLPNARWEVNMPLLQVSGIVKRCDLLVGGSTGLTHIADAVATPVIGLWAVGDTIWRPLGKTSLTIVKHQPDGWEREDYATQHETGYVRQIPLDMVLDLSQRILEGQLDFNEYDDRMIVL